ncbi:EcoRII N-terminal effector-binding domain-containing protein [Sphingomonas sp. PB2P19]|uniref:EcoRII N-terminal effector-binding domain-containing protein n=1 Tax=Sphingomonas rhamnosi TaxID=3096156 RepID=UPI002FC9EE4E
MVDRSIAKVLSKNDTGETGGHQAGILVPKETNILSFFPSLDASQYNPRAHLMFMDESGAFWEFAFIYYNNALFGGTRNEYRLTRMTKYIRQASLVVGDEVILSHDGQRYNVTHKRKRQTEISAAGVLKLGSGWRVVEI